MCQWKVMGEVRVLTYCQAKSMSRLGTKNEPVGSEVINDKNLRHREHTIRNEDTSTLPPLVSENGAIGDPLVFFCSKEVTVQPPQMVQLVGEGDLSQNRSDEVDGERLLISVCAHDLLDPGEYPVKD